MNQGAKKDRMKQAQFEWDQSLRRLEKANLEANQGEPSFQKALQDYINCDKAVRDLESETERYCIHCNTKLVKETYEGDVDIQCDGEDCSVFHRAIKPWSECYACKNCQAYDLCITCFAAEESQVNKN